VHIFIGLESLNRKIRKKTAKIKTHTILNDVSAIYTDVLAMYNKQKPSIFAKNYYLCTIMAL